MLSDLDDFIAFAHRWFGARPGELGLPRGKIPADVPAPLAKLYCEIGVLTKRHSPWAKARDRRPPLQSMDRLLHPDELGRGGDCVDFAWQHQNDWSARCLRMAGDPHVEMNWAGNEDRSLGMQHVSVGAALSDFLVSFCLQEIAWHGYGLARDRAPLWPKFAVDRWSAEMAAADRLATLPLWVDHNVFNYIGWGDVPSNAPSHSFFVSPDERVLAFSLRRSPRRCVALRDMARRTTW